MAEDKFFYRIRLQAIKDYAEFTLQDNDLLTKLKSLDGKINSSVESVRGNRKLQFRRASTVKK